jgi:hypothetical protein
MDNIEIQAVGAELITLAERDQSMRRSRKWDDSLDPIHTARLKEIIKELDGWPCITKIGTEACDAAWLLAQHADVQPEFQQQCLEMMKAAPEGEVKLRHIAYLEDRVRVNFGRPQVYGTQFSSVGNILRVRPIEDENRLEARRRSMSLEPFAENMARVQALVNEEQ